MKIFFDGGCRPLPGGMEVAVVVRGQTHLQQRLGPGTSMDAEWLALIEAIRHAHDEQIFDAVVLGDAANVIAQANGAMRCPTACLRHLCAFELQPRPQGRLRIRYVKRTQNLAGIALGAMHAR